MTEDAKFSCADFRVRLFLSIDLSGSTAFKNSRDGEARDRASPKWVTIFETFYRDFPAKFQSNYALLKTVQTGYDACPALWKAVGDELIFCGRVNNRKSVIAALMAFIKTLLDYRKSFLEEGLPLNLKGAGWLASFPEPNRAVTLRSLGSGENYLTASEALEAAADAQPFEYDFLGKAIDTGFRVAGFARPERFVLCVQLAKLLASSGRGSGFDYEIRFDEPVALKGVNGGEAYPVLYIDTLTHLMTESIRVQERRLLRRHDAPTRDELNGYLEAYCDVVGTEELVLPLSASDPPSEPPRSYSTHREKISEHLLAEKGREIGDLMANEPDDAGGGDFLEGEGLEPLV
ncbi:hypothetical protein [Cereibacter johrii]|uniref:hypothetical protein n=1 Tax=Cereibacter johrii TaxID=445629 RepID=UPI003CF5C825